MLRAQYSTPVETFERNIDDGGSSVPLRDVYEAALNFLRRQYPAIGFGIAIMLALGFTYIFTAQPSYTATTDLLIDSAKVRLFQPQSMFTDLPADSATVDSQVGILKSETIARAVIKKLNLIDDPSLTGSGSDLFSAALSRTIKLVSPSSPTSNTASVEAQAIAAFRHRLNVTRQGLTYLIAISFRSPNADRAAQIANAVAQAYIDDQLEAKYVAARRAGSWLQGRLQELREQAAASERAVVDFKNKNKLVDAGGRTINEQQLAELNSQLVQAQAQTGEAHARLDRVQMILTSKSPEATVDATVADTLKSDVITKLRSQYLELAERAANWASRYGPTHLAVVNLRNQMREIQNSVREELQRIAETYKSDVKIAEQREASIHNQLDQAVSHSQVANQAQVTLRQLQTNAQSYQALYDNFLQRYMESVQQQSFPITEARIISAASTPSHPSNPRVLLVLGLAGAVGLIFGCGAGVWREITDRVFRTRTQVEEHLLTDCIALVPAVATGKEEFGAGSRRDSKITNLRGQENGTAGPQPLRTAVDADPERSSAQIEAGERNIVPLPGMYSAVIGSPFSAFAEGIRAIKVAIDLSPLTGGARVVGFTSSIPNEGKSSIAVAVARLVAQTGARTLLVDCDLKNPALSRLLSPRAPAGLIETVKSQSTLEEVIWSDDVTNMKFLPVAMRARLAHSSEVIASVQTRIFFNSLRNNYDYIFVDFAPLTPIVDVRVSTHLVDSFVYVVEWGKTRIDHVRQALQSARGIHEHLLGVVLNKVDLRSIGRFDGSGAHYYRHANYYNRYGYTE